MNIPLNDLVPATTKREPHALPVADPKSLARTRADARIRLIAQEYVRNGMNFADAYRTITNVKSKSTMFKTLRHHTDAFMDEVRRMMEESSIDKVQALNLLWSMVNTSILDFMDENGNVLQMKELKKLPRVMQLMLHRVKIESTQKPARDEHGKVMLNDMGDPYLVTHAKVEIEIPEKMAALQQLAQLMKWTTPQSVTNVLNIGVLMTDADARQRKLGQTYDAD